MKTHFLGQFQKKLLMANGRDHVAYTIPLENWQPVIFAVHVKANRTMRSPNFKSNLTEEAKARGRAAQQFTRRWYKDTLLKIFRGEIKCSSTQLNALTKFADQRGWFPPNRPKTQAIAEKRSKVKPQANDDVLQRLVAFNVTTLPNLQHGQNIAKQGN